ncbi:MAG: FadR family transcriptional regulator [Proteobacteria bacterium]|nr:FadR family transcriptional regulator [Pseudomonadota bacterium]
MGKNQPHLKAFNHLLKQIFNRQLKTSEKIPPVRKLSKELNVDVASIRIALKQLESMNLLDIRHGDGAYVKDYMKSGGVDLLSVVFNYQGEKEGETIVDEFLMDDICVFWDIILPEIFNFALKRFSAMERKDALQILDQQEENVGNLSRLVELELEFEDKIAEVTHNIFFSLLNNSLRPIRRKVNEMIILGTGQENYIKTNTFRKKMLKFGLSGSSSAGGVSPDEIRNLVSKGAEVVRETIRQEALGTGVDSKPK